MPLFFVLTLISCASRIDGSLAADGSAFVNLNISFEPRMTALIRSFSQAGGQAGGPVLNGPAIAQSMSAAPGVIYAVFRNISDSAIEGQVRISHVNNFLSASGMSFITFEQGSQGGRCVININLNNGPAIIPLFSQEIKEYLEAFLAPLVTGERLTRSQYLDEVAVFYNRTISNEIASSRIIVSIDFPGTITGVRGGLFSGRRANFDIPLLDLLVLETPLSYEVTWN